MSISPLHMPVLFLDRLNIRCCVVASPTHDHVYSDCVPSPTPQAAGCLHLWLLTLTPLYILNSKTKCKAVYIWTNWAICTDSEYLIGMELGEESHSDDVLSSRTSTNPLNCRNRQGSCVTWEVGKKSLTGNFQQLLYPAHVSLCIRRQGRE